MFAKTFSLSAEFAISNEFDKRGTLSWQKQKWILVMSRKASLLYETYQIIDLFFSSALIQ